MMARDDVKIVSIAVLRSALVRSVATGEKRRDPRDTREALEAINILFKVLVGHWLQYSLVSWCRGGSWIRVQVIKHFSGGPIVY